MSKDAGIDHISVVAIALAVTPVRHSNHSAKSQPHSAESHPHSAKSYPQSAKSHPQSAKSHPHSAKSHPHSVKLIRSHLFDLLCLESRNAIVLNFHINYSTDHTLKSVNTADK